MAEEANFEWQRGELLNTWIWRGLAVVDLTPGKWTVQDRPDAISKIIDAKRNPQTILKLFNEAFRLNVGTINLTHDQTETLKKEIQAFMSRPENSSMHPVLDIYNDSVKINQNIYSNIQSQLDFQAKNAASKAAVNPLDFNTSETDEDARDLFKR